MTLAASPPSMEFSIIEFFFEPFPKVNLFIVLTKFLWRLSQRIYGNQSMEHNQKSITKYLQKITDFVKLRMGDKIKLQIQCLEVGNQALSSEKLKSKLISEGEDIEAL